MTQALFNFTDTRRSGAEFSPCRKFRYVLWRRWSNFDNPRMCAFVGVNPSVANEHQNDRTISRCIGFAKSWGYDGLLMLNAFAHVQTKLGKLKLDHEHVGPINDMVIKTHQSQGVLIVAAWGTHCPLWRQIELVSLLGTELQCLGKNDDGTPKHPLFLRGDTKPNPWCVS